MGLKRKNSRRDSSSRTDSMSIRSAFIVNMFREFPDRVFSMKQLTSASGGNSKEARYMVRDILVLSFLKFHHIAFAIYKVFV